MFRKRRPPVGAQPGAFSHERTFDESRIHLIQYNGEGLTEVDLEEISQINEQLNRKGVLWIDVQGFGDTSQISAISDLLAFHPLAVADVINIPQRPKVEDFENYLFVVVQMARINSLPIVKTEQVSFFLGQNFLVSFQENHGDVFDPVRRRIRDGRGMLRKQGPDYLLYALLDAIIDGYYPVLERVGDYLEDLEEQVIDDPQTETLREVHNIKRELLTLRRTLWPTREMLSTLLHDETKLIKKPVRPYLRDCQDHLVQVLEVTENYRELVVSLMDVYMSGISNRLNEVMKVLTMIATVFIPLSFIVGIYGMNFEYMPELKYKWAYPAVWLVILSVAGGMFYAFSRAGWISLRKPLRKEQTE